MNPFIIDSPVPPEELIDREPELGKLLDLALGGHNTRVSAPRRYGKTTLLERLRVEAEKAGAATVYVDCFGVLSLGELAQRIDLAYHASLKGPVAQWFAGVRRRWVVRLKGGLSGTGGEIESLPPHQAETLLGELLDLPREIHRRDGSQTLVQFDEFQEVLSASDRADAVIRSKIQHHRHEAAYVFAGSHPGLMRELFDTSERPLYGQARPIELPPLADEPLLAYVASRFEGTGRELGAAGDPLLDLARGHPQRAMLLAHHLWEATQAGSTADIECWERASGEALRDLQETFERAWERLSVNERRTLTAVAWTGPWGGGSTLYGADTLSRFRLAKSTAQDLATALERRGELHRGQDGTLELVDPLFEAWIASLRRARR
jgi:uncharacterized protein